MPTLSVIAAVADNGVIGDKNALLWHISEDLRNFKRITSGHTVIMGRKTFESLGRPLPNRRNIVITRSNSTFEGCETIHSLSEALTLCADEEEVFIIGGAQIYAEALPTADRMYLTIVRRNYDGDTVFPTWNRNEWHLVQSEHFGHGAEYEYPFDFELYERK